MAAAEFEPRSVKVGWKTTGPSSDANSVSAELEIHADPAFDHAGFGELQKRLLATLAKTWPHDPRVRGAGVAVRPQAMTCRASVMACCRSRWSKGLPSFGKAREFAGNSA